MTGGKSFQVGFVFGAKKASSFDKTLGGINKSLSGMTKAVSGIMKGMVGFAAAKAGLNGIGDAIDTYKGFEQSMANVKALSGASGATFDALKDKAMEMGRKTSKTAQEAADALGYMSLAGWDAEKSMTALEPVLRLSEAGGLDLARTSDLVTDSMSALGIEVEKLPQFLDQVAKTSSKSNTNIDALMEAFVRAGGSLKGMPLEEVNATLGVLANRGLKGAEAGTAISSLMANFKVKSGQAYEALKKLGVSAYDSQGNFKGIEATMIELNDTTKDLTKEQRDMYFAMIGGKEQAKALDSIMAGLNTVNEEGITEFEALKRAAAGSDGALMDMANTMNDTMQGAFARLSSATDDMKIRMVEVAGPYITPFINALAEKIPKATDVFIKGLQRGVEWLKGVGTRAGEMKDKAVQAFEWVKGKASIAFNAIKAKALEVKPQFDAFASAIMDIGGKVKDFMQRGFELAQPVIDWVATTGLPSVVGALGSVLGFASDVYNFFSSNWCLIAPGIGGIIGALVAFKAISLGVAAAEKIKTGVMIAGKAVMLVVTAAQWAWNAAMTANPIGIIIVAIGALIGAGVMLAANWDKIKAKAFELWEGIKTALAPVGEWFSGIWDSIKSGFKAFINFIIGGLNWMIGGLNKLHVDVPDWVPLVGGKSLGFSIPEIPLLAQGGVATAPTLAMVGEGKENEAILPLSKLESMVSPQPALQSVAILNPLLPYLRQISEQLNRPGPNLSDRDITALLQKILDALDKDPPPDGGGGPVQITYAPNVYIYGDANKEDVASALDDDYKKFQENMDRYLRDKRRVDIRR